MDLFTQEDLRALLAERAAPCLSLFLPTHRGGAEADPIRWRGLLKEAEERLTAAGMRSPDAGEFLKSARLLTDDVLFWKNQGDGLAFFLAPHFVRAYRLPLRFDGLVMVAERFQVTPLLPLLTDNGRFFALALSQNAVRLLHGTHYSVTEIDLQGVPRNLAEALLTHDRDEVLTFHTRPAGGIGSWGAIFHGHGVGIDDKKDDLLLYFQRIDRGLHAVLREEHAPLVLAAVDYLHPLYRQASTYPHLLEQGLDGNPDRLSARELHDRAWILVQPLFQERRERAAAQYRQLAGTGRTAGAAAEVVPAAYQGQVETLFVARGRQRWGRFDPATQKVEEHEHVEPGDEDLLNFAAVHVLRHGGTVYAPEPEQVPGGGLMVAVFRLPLAKHGKRP